MGLWSLFGGVKRTTADASSHGTLGYAPTKAGETVTPESSLGLSVYLACLRVISEDIAMLPLDLKERQKPRGWAPAKKHPVRRMLRWQMCPLMTNLDFRQSETQKALSYGNAYAEIELDTRGRPIALWPIHPTRVKPERVPDPDNPMRSVLIYRVRVDDTEAGRTVREVPILSENMFHLRGFGEDIEGVSPMQAGAEAIGAGLAMQKYSSAFFGNGTTPGVALMVDKGMTEQTRQRLRAAWNEAHQGAGKSFMPFICDLGMDLKTYTVNPVDAELAASREWNVQEICRFFRVNPIKVQHGQNTALANVEPLNQQHVNDALMPWTKRWETEIRAKLLPEREWDDHEANHDFHVLLRGNMAARASYMRSLIPIGVMKPEEAREQEGLDYDPDVDGLFMQGAMVPVANLLEPEPESEQQPTAAPGEPGRPTNDEARAILRPAALDAANRLAHREALTWGRHGDDSEKAKAARCRFYDKHREEMARACDPILEMAQALAGEEQVERGRLAMLGLAEEHCRTGRNAFEATPESLATSILDAILGESHAAPRPVACN